MLHRTSGVNHPREDDMATITGSEVLAKALRSQGVDTMFYVMGGPMLETEAACIQLGIRAIDTRHEQAAALSAHAWTRVTRRPGVAMGCSGPGATNLLTGVANAFTDCAPLVAIGGSSPRVYLGMEAFQEIDQVAVFKPVTKLAARIYDARRIPDVVATAFREATSGRPGPVYLDLPGDILGEKIDEDSVTYPAAWKPAPRTLGDPNAVREAIALLARAERPVVLAGSGVWWSDGARALQAFVEATGIPFYTTPISRGLVPEDHALAFLNARSKAFTEADVVLAVGTRFNWVVQFGRPPRFAGDLRVIHVDVNPGQLGHNRAVDVPIAGDARAVLEQLAAEAQGRIDPGRYSAWAGKLRVLDAEKGAEQDKAMSTDNTPIHPLRLCKEVRDFLKRDAILVVDGQEILNYGRQAIPTFKPGHRLNSGAFGCMGVGLPFGVGAKVARPDTQVVVLHGDGSYGLNAMEIDTAVRHTIPVMVIISNNGGWTADAPWTRPLPKPGRNLGHTRYDKVAQELGAHGEFVEKPHEIRPALERAYASGKPAVVNVITDSKARAQTVRFSAYTT
jgi:thiamine pyrophosphate-dependent acetolactate synthase large subunit-like protein